MPMRARQPNVNVPQAIEFIDVKTMKGANTTNECTKIFQRHICGYIEVSADNKTYTMLCQQCEQEFAIWDWVKFVKHAKEAHSYLQHAFASALNSGGPSAMEECGGVFVITAAADERKAALALPLQKSLQKEVFEEKSEPRVAAVQDEVFAEALKPLILRNFVELEEKTHDNQPSRQENILEESQLETEKDKSEIIENPKSCNSHWDSDSGANNTDDTQDFGDVIYINKAEPEIVLDFLALLREHPKLLGQHHCHGYNGALSTATKQFNEKWSRSMTLQDMQRSVTLMKRWYRAAVRMWKKKGYDSKKATAMNGNWQLYFDTCKALIPPRDCKKFCEQCQREFSTPARYRHHVVQHEEPKFKCQLCPRKYYFASMLTHHMKLHNNQLDYVCEVCGKLFLQRKYLKEHARTHIPDRRLNFVCDLCGNTFLWRQTLRKHKVDIHGFPKAKALVNVAKRHMDTTVAGNNENKDEDERLLSREKRATKKNRKRYLCKICGNTFAWRQGLYKHKLKFHGELKTTASTDADEELSDMGASSPEVRKAQRIRLVCNFCDKTFAWPQGLHKHRKQIHGVKVRVRNRKAKPKLPSSGNENEHKNIADFDAPQDSEGRILLMDMFQVIPDLLEDTITNNVSCNYD